MATLYNTKIQEHRENLPWELLKLEELYFESSEVLSCLKEENRSSRKRIKTMERNLLHFLDKAKSEIQRKEGQIVGLQMGIVNKCLRCNPSNKENKKNPIAKNSPKEKTIEKQTQGQHESNAYKKRIVRNPFAREKSSLETKRNDRNEDYYRIINNHCKNKSEYISALPIKEQILTQNLHDALRAFKKATINSTITRSLHAQNFYETQKNPENDRHDFNNKRRIITNDRGRDAVQPVSKKFCDNQDYDEREVKTRRSSSPEMEPYDCWDDRNSEQGTSSDAASTISQRSQSEDSNYKRVNDYESRDDDLEWDGNQFGSILLESKKLKIENENDDCVQESNQNTNQNLKSDRTWVTDQFEKEVFTKSENPFEIDLKFLTENRANIFTMEETLETLMENADPNNFNSEYFYKKITPYKPRACLEPKTDKMLGGTQVELVRLFQGKETLVKDNNMEKMYYLDVQMLESTEVEIPEYDVEFEISDSDLLEWDALTSIKEKVGDRVESFIDKNILPANPNYQHKSMKIHLADDKKKNSTECQHPANSEDQPKPTEPAFMSHVGKTIDEENKITSPALNFSKECNEQSQNENRYLKGSKDNEIEISLNSQSNGIVNDSNVVKIKNRCVEPGLNVSTKAEEKSGQVAVTDDSLTKFTKTSIPKENRKRQYSLEGTQDDTNNVKRHIKE